MPFTLYQAVLETISTHEKHSTSMLFITEEMQFLEPPMVIQDYRNSSQHSVRFFILTLEFQTLSAEPIAIDVDYQCLNSSEVLVLVYISLTAL